jgi:hypothetical protein
MMHYPTGGLNKSASLAPCVSVIWGLQNGASNRSSWFFTLSFTGPMPDYFDIIFIIFLFFMFSNHFITSFVLLRCSLATGNHGTHYKFVTTHILLFFIKFFFLTCIMTFLRDLMLLIALENIIKTTDIFRWNLPS